MLDEIKQTRGDLNHLQALIDDDREKITKRETNFQQECEAFEEQKSVHAKLIEEQQDELSQMRDAVVEEQK